jgi:hypothetical protein
MTRKPLQGRPVGRPRKDDPSLRSEWLRARVRPDELHRIEQLARDAGKTPSEYVRDAALTAQILIKRTRRVPPGLLNELSRIGNNLNQIAKVCNTTGESRRARSIEIYLDELRPVLKRLYELQ